MTKQTLIDHLPQWLLACVAMLAGVSNPSVALAQPEPMQSPPVVSYLQLMELPVLSLPPLGGSEYYLPSEGTTVHLMLKLGERRVYLYQGEQVLASYPVAIGESDTPTPVGEFEVFEMVENPIWRNPWTGEVRSPGANSALGLRWIGFVHMPNGVIGFHGTPTVSSIGQAASNGCVRMHNEDVVALFTQVEVGTPVMVVP